MVIADGKNHLTAVRELIGEYSSRQGRDLSFQDLEEELKDPARKYTPPEGELLVALEGTETRCPT